MHFVMGGAFNGKSNWVRKTYPINDQNSIWVSGYAGEQIPDSLPPATEYWIVSGIEQYVKDWLIACDEKAVREKWLGKLTEWSCLDGDQTMILIGSDISKGIVPASHEERLWRDVAGRIFQDTAKICDRVDVIWYGINIQIK
ncbi:bifunctional adenosylcobinamide kinase/adenosylcobinamide-phosphate guanylyltransferase [Caldifermentibacillus hisashii]|uniref:bifunctional adenosylcobinamide kinase/adenosylcobinamide-phosphate guanylyltransferase n=1 Tax=Caldifermentibacillus hisashii TaxID=996558 RepID=UPI001C0F9D6C|nr:bifunctional adenosylcobinamide kinase/adenosylcobinamide-phosphate guanylyltransferase [Caldifermentibacillus hisashii]MBU5342366.1 bifunctional adenosylcobinamide kinase/adenosylcobinamide-phosphate guanylyltransferase [Caldifermentibacillus hisashii]